MNSKEMHRTVEIVLRILCLIVGVVGIYKGIELRISMDGISGAFLIYYSGFLLLTGLIGKRYIIGVGIVIHMIILFFLINFGNPYTVTVNEEGIAEGRLK